MRLWSSASILQALPCTVPYLQPFIVCLPAVSVPERRFGSPMFPSVLEHTLTIVCFCGIILAQELVLLSMIVGAIQLYHRRTFSCSLFVTHVLYLNKNKNNLLCSYQIHPWVRIPFSPPFSAILFSIFRRAACCFPADEGVVLKVNDIPFENDNLAQAQAVECAEQERQLRSALPCVLSRSV